MADNQNDIEKRLSKLEDELAIQKVVYNYCYKQDQRNIEEFLKLLTDDIVFTFPGWGVDVRGKETLKDFFLEQVFATHEYHMHQISNLNMQIEDGNAEGEAYLSMQSSCGGEPQEAGIRYILKLRKENNQWKLSEIHCRLVTWKGTLAPKEDSVFERFKI